LVSTITPTPCRSDRSPFATRRERDREGIPQFGLVAEQVAKARACFAQGKFERAAALFERAAEIKPDDYQSLCLLIQIYRTLGRDADGQAAARRGIELAQSELTLHPENQRAAYGGAIALLAIGEKDRSKEWLSRALALDPDDILTQYNVACAYSLLGDIEAAFDLLVRLLPHANHETKAWIKHHSDFDPLRSHPRYQKVLELIG